MAEREILGFVPIYRPAPGTIVTQAFILCSKCGGYIAANNGPKQNALCIKCVSDFVLENLPDPDG